MNEKIVLRAIVTSILITATVRISYGVENIYMLAAINIVMALGTYFGLTSYDEKMKNEKEKHNTEVKDMVENNDKKMEKVFYELNNSMKNNTTEINKNLSNQIKISNELNEVINKQFKENQLLKVHIKEVIEDINNESKDSNNKQKIINDSILKNHNELKQMNIRLDKQIEKNIDIEKVLKDIDNKAEKTLDTTKDISIEVSNMKEENKGLIKELIQNVKVINDKCIDVEGVLKEIDYKANGTLNTTKDISLEVSNMKEENKGLIKELIQNVKVINDKCIDVEGILNEIDNKANGTLNTTKDISMEVSNIKEENKESIKELIQNVKVINDKCIDVEGVLRDIDNKVEESVDKTQDISDTVEGIKNDNQYSTTKINGKIEESIEANNSLTSKYEEIQNHFTAELFKTATKNELVANLLKDNYILLKKISALN